MRPAPRHAFLALAVGLVAVYCTQAIGADVLDENSLARAIVAEVSRGTPSPSSSGPLYAALAMAGAYALVREIRATLKETIADVKTMGASTATFLHAWRPNVTVRHIQAEDTAAHALPPHPDP